MSEDEDGELVGQFDRLLNFTLPDRHARGRVVRLGPVLGRILGAHEYPPAIKHLLAEALVLTSLMGGLLKREGSQLTMQAQSESGAVELLVCDYRDGQLRGYVKHDAERFAALGADHSLPALFGKGRLVLTFDLPATGQRYQGVVPLQGDALAEAVESYFARSEQVPTLIRASVRHGAGGAIAGGLLVQHLADREEGNDRLHLREEHLHWEHVSIMARSVSHEELVDAALPPEALVWRLYHEEREVRVEPATTLSRGCRCSIVHFEEVLARFPKDDRREMRDENGIIRVDCAFCSREFLIED